MVGFRDHTFVWLEDCTGTIDVDMECSKYENYSAKCCEALNALQPVIVQVVQYHVRLRRLQDQVTELLDLQR